MEVPEEKVRARSPSTGAPNLMNAYMKKFTDIKITKAGKVYIFLLSLVVCFVIVLAMSLGSRPILMILFVVLIGPTVGLVGHLDKKFGAADFSIADALRVYGKNILASAENLLDVVGAFLVDVYLKIYVMVFTTALVSLATLWIFMTPDGLPGIIARFLVGYSHKSGLTDFTALYAAFSTAVVTLVLIIASTIKTILISITYFDDKFDDEVEDKP
jgi:hypothetical protein